MNENTNRFILLALKEIAFPYLIFSLLMFTRVRIPTGMSSIKDLLDLLQIIVILLFGYFALLKGTQGWNKLKTVCSFEEYKDRIAETISVLAKDTREKAKVRK